MSYRTKKRRLQKKQHLVKVRWWKDFREAEADRAFKDWKEINSHLLEIYKIERSN